MSLVINTNVASLNSQRQLMNSGGALDKATERLSSANVLILQKMTLQVWQFQIE